MAGQYAFGSLVCCLLVTLVRWFVPPLNSRPHRRGKQIHHTLLYVPSLHAPPRTGRDGSILWQWLLAALQSVLAVVMATNYSPALSNVAVILSAWLYASVTMRNIRLAYVEYTQLKFIFKS